MLGDTGQVAAIQPPVPNCKMELITSPITSMGLPHHLGLRMTGMGLEKYLHSFGLFDGHAGLAACVA